MCLSVYKTAFSIMHYLFIGKSCPVTGFTNISTILFWMKFKEIQN